MADMTTDWSHDINSYYNAVNICSTTTNLVYFLTSKSLRHQNTIRSITWRNLKTQTRSEIVKIRNTNTHRIKFCVACVEITLFITFLTNKGRPTLSL